MNKYIIRTGVWKEVVEAESLEDVKEQQWDDIVYRGDDTDDIVIYDIDGVELSRAHWWAVAAETERELEDEDVLADFGRLGYYTQWVDM